MWRCATDTPNSGGALRSPRKVERMRGIVCHHVKAEFGAIDEIVVNLPSKRLKWHVAVQRPPTHFPSHTVSWSVWSPGNAFQPIFYMATTSFTELSQQLKHVQQNSAACHCSRCLALLCCVVNDAPLLQNFLQSLCIPFTNNQKNLRLLRSLLNSSAQLSWF